QTIESKARGPSVLNVKRTSVTLTAVLTLASCAVGPDFKSPDAPAAANGGAYTPAPMPQQTVAAPGAAGAAQSFSAGQAIPAQWWLVFHSDALDRLIRASLVQSP